MNPLDLTQIRPSQRSARRTLSLARRLAPALLLGLAPLLSPAQTRVVQAADICPGGSGSVVACVVNTDTGPGTWTWTVPAGVTSVTVDAFGAQGGGAAGVKGGLGGEATATLAVTPGATYQINVGGYGGSDQMRAAGARASTRSPLEWSSDITSAMAISSTVTQSNRPASRCASK